MVRVHASPRGYIRLSLVFYLLGIWFNGGLAQLARAPALHAGGHRFDSDILHNQFYTEKFFDILKTIHEYLENF